MMHQNTPDPLGDMVMQALRAPQSTTTPTPAGPKRRTLATAGAIGAAVLIGSAAAVALPDILS